MPERRETILDRLKRKLRPIFKRVDRLESEAVSLGRRAVKGIRSRLRDRLETIAEKASVGIPFGWGPPWLRALQAATRESVQEANQEFIAGLPNKFSESLDVGRRLVDESIRAVAPDLVEAARLKSLVEIPGLRDAYRSLRAGLSESLNLQQQEIVERLILSSLVNGESAATLAKKLAAKLDEEPWRSATWRVERLARTELARATQAAVLARIGQLGFELPGVIVARTYVTLPMPPWPCKSCRPWDGKIFAVDGTAMDADGTLRYDLPRAPEIPLHPCCFPGNTLVRPIGDTELVYKRPYNGILFEVTLSDGSVLSATPNHPVLTSRGFVPIAEVNEGDYLVNAFFGDSNGFGISSKSSSDTHINDGYVPIENIFKSFSDSYPTQRIVDRPANFHGDGGNEGVEIVGPKRKLSPNLYTSISNGLNDLSFPGANFPVTAECPFCLRRFSAAPSSQMSLFREAHLGKSENIGFRTSSDFNSVFSKDPAYSGSASADRLRYREAGFSAGVSFNDFGSKMIVSSNPIDINASFFKNLDYSRTANAEGFGDLFNDNSREIEFNRAVSINRVRFTGHVYNLQTSSGVYSATGIVVKNCRCGWVPFVIGRTPRVLRNENAAEVYIGGDPKDLTDRRGQVTSARPPKDQINESRRLLL